MTMENEGASLTLGERAADVIRNGMGSWGFVGGALVFLAMWIAGVTVYHWDIDNPQLTILNLGLSCLAALQGSILLIAARRQDQIADALARHIYQAQIDTKGQVEQIDLIVTHIEHDEHGMKARMDALEGGHGRIIEILEGRALTEAQIRRMAERFLGWRLPDDFQPDAGISFKAEFNDSPEAMKLLGLKEPMRHEPVGTNLFSYTQAEAMVRYMAEALSEGSP